jgi:signal transduction histidine kinase
MADRHAALPTRPGSYRVAFRRILTAPLSTRTPRELLYALAALPLGVLWFSVVVTLLSTSVAMVVTLVGVPMLVGTLLLVRLGAEGERRWARLVLGADVPAAAPLRGPAGAPWWRRALSLLVDPARWREALYLLLLLPSGIALFVVAVTVWAVALSFVTAPLWYWAVPNDTDLLWDGNESALELVGIVGIGLVALVAAPWAVHGLVRVQLWVMRVLIGPTRRELERAAAQATKERDLAVGHVESDRRRVERDLHDGAQTRLVALAVDLGRARQRLEEGATTEEAAVFVRDAHEHAKQALAEVRDLARGIHPAVLTDRGLDAALSSLVARSPVPATLHADLSERLPTEVEAAAYFVAAEALANAGKHSGATRVAVSAALEGDELVLEVRDDGVGGASVQSGSGLAGLAERVGAVGGRLELESPAGGPTCVRAVLRCG